MRGALRKIAPPGGALESPKIRVKCHATPHATRSRQIEPKGEAKGAKWEAKETQMHARGASLEHARTTLVTVRAAHGQVLGGVRGLTFLRPRSRTLSGEVLWSPFGVCCRFWSPFGVAFATTLTPKRSLWAIAGGKLLSFPLTLDLKIECPPGGALRWRVAKNRPTPRRPLK